VSPDGEYEWWRKIGSTDIPALIQALGGRPQEDILDVLEREATGARSYDLEQLLRDGTVPSTIQVY
jgi:hypothetical protein